MLLEEINEKMNTCSLCGKKFASFRQRVITVYMSYGNSDMNEPRNVHSYCWKNFRDFIDDPDELDDYIIR